MRSRRSSASLASASARSSSTPCSSSVQQRWRWPLEAFSPLHPRSGGRRVAPSLPPSRTDVDRRRRATQATSGGNDMTQNGNGHRAAVGGTLILGGGFGGAYVARLVGKAGATIVSPDSSMLYTPLLPEVAAGSIEPRHAVVPLRMMCPS